MAGVNQILNFVGKYTDDIAKIVASKGDDTVGIFCRQAKPIKSTEYKTLRFASEMIGDTMNLPLSNNLLKNSKQIELTKLKNFPEVPPDRGFLAFYNGKPIARYQYIITSPSSKASAIKYPKEWIETNGIPKKSLFIDYIATEEIAPNSGFGRLLIQRLYHESILKGCEGRISLFSSFNSHGFYDKLGFEVGEQVIQKKRVIQNQLREDLQNLLTNKQKGLNINNEEIINIELELQKISEELSIHVPCEPGALYFTPTEQNLKKLFKK